MRKITLAALTLLLTTAVAYAQHDAGKKPLSPPAKATATFGGKKVTIDYSAPSKRNRAVMGALVPYGKVWRTGANAATTLTTETDLMIGSLHVPAGTYTLYTIPNEKNWTLIVNKQTGQWGTQYNEAQDLGRVKLDVKRVKTAVETFAIDLRRASDKKGTLSFTWENTQATVPVMVH
ncbi:MAG: DUF2911 domain-containing protein [Acidobacteriota bacterium]|nr:DUF2911 domain-containing protein [Acidobacteriota bacterium]